MYDFSVLDIPSRPLGWWNSSPTFDVQPADPREHPMAKKSTAHDKPALNRGNLERAAQLARRAAAELDRQLAVSVSADDAVSHHPADAIAALSDALTELGE